MLPRMLGGLKKPEGGRQTQEMGAAIACRPARFAASGRAVPALDVRFSFHLLEVLRRR